MIFKLLKNYCNRSISNNLRNNVTTTCPVQGSTWDIHKGRRIVDVGTPTKKSNKPHILAALTLRKRVPANHLTGDHVDPRNKLDVVTKRITAVARN